MRRTIAAILLVALGLQTAGCTTFKAPVIPPTGFILTRWKAPLTTHFDRTPADPPKHGAMHCFYLREPIFGTDYAWRRADVAGAAKSAGITKLHYADYEVLQVLGVFGRFEIIAHGE